MALAGVVMQRGVKSIARDRRGQDSAGSAPELGFRALFWLFLPVLSSLASLPLWSLTSLHFSLSLLSPFLVFFFSFYLRPSLDPFILICLHSWGIPDSGIHLLSSTLACFQLLVAGFYDHCLSGFLLYSLFVSLIELKLELCVESREEKKKAFL